MHITPEKGGNPRTLPLSNKLLAMLLKLKRNNEYVFKTTILKHFRSGYLQQRKRIAEKIENPRINRIQFKTFRHFKGTMEYHKTKDILHVKHVLGHRNIKNTLVYTHLVSFPDEEEFITKVTRENDQAQQLLDNGFNYELTSPDGLMFFRKRK